LVSFPITFDALFREYGTGCRADFLFCRYKIKGSHVFRPLSRKSGALVVHADRHAIRVRAIVNTPMTGWVGAEMHCERQDREAHQVELHDDRRGGFVALGSMSSPALPGVEGVSP
jgi:hypothetical protein